MIRENETTKTTETVDLSRRKVLLSGAKYAALVPVSTVLVAKSARAGGSGVTFTFPSGAVATNSGECLNVYDSGNGDTFSDVLDCIATFSA